MEGAGRGERGGAGTWGSEIEAVLSPQALTSPTDTQPQSSPGKLGASDILAALCEAGMEGFNLLDHFLQTPAQSSRLNKQGFSTAQKLASFSASPIC